MARAYFQCPNCKRPAATNAKSGEKASIQCACGRWMKFRGFGDAGRNNWPFGPPKFQPEPSPETKD